MVQCNVDPNELVFTLGFFTSVQFWVKSDQEMRSRECAQTDRQMHRRKTVLQFVLCYML